MAITIEGFTMQQPRELQLQDVTQAYRVPVDGPAIGMVVQSKVARAGATLEMLAGETLAELAVSLPAVKDVNKSPMTFNDGGAGIVLSFWMPSKVGELRQYYVMRLDNGRLCSVSLTIPRPALTEGNAQRYMEMIASLAVQK